MTEPTVPTAPAGGHRRAISIAMHGEAVTQVRAIDLTSEAGRLVDLRIGSDLAGVSLIGDLELVHQMILDAAVELGRIATGRTP